ncbi:hypothetical protein BVRB_7g165120 [Beta vulgaris subsp. vulgaris]|uniref:Legume lectin domain-containing protein n=1 Tax=Beta vulgaris subsp. vulgaris TaxID=3555 RepID=A0A0J8BXL8_BETVV|nr:hypothetical protein BVRB_7g165120 [Beta vulgaris subsp. vulgaris]
MSTTTPLYGLQLLLLDTLLLLLGHLATATAYPTFLLHGYSSNNSNPSLIRISSGNFQRLPLSKIETNFGVFSFLRFKGMN